MNRVRFAVLALGLFVACPVAHATDYTIDKNHSSVGFRIRHLVSQVRGQFADYQGTVSYDPQKPMTSRVQVTIQTASIDTSNPKRDGHLKSPDFFDVAKYPTITFMSQTVTQGPNGHLMLAGPLTMHGVTKPVTLDVEATGTVKDPMGKGTRAGFRATTTLNRKDFGISWNKTMDNGGVMLGEEVNVEIEIEAVSK